MNRIQFLFSRAVLILATILSALALTSPSHAAGFPIDKSSTQMSGLWYNANESGWGMSVTHQFGVMFVAIYTYDASGAPTWYVASGCNVVGDGCSDSLLRVSGGEPLTSVWSGANKQTTPVGNIRFSFTTIDKGDVFFTINGVSSSKAITRLLFASPVSPPTGGSDYPILFKSVRIDGVSFKIRGSDPSTASCDATVTFTNTGASTIAGITLRFDIIVGGVTVRQVPFLWSGLAAGATASDTAGVSSGTGGTGGLGCDYFTLRFNPLASFAQ
jgi:hypothetical protein